MNFFVEFFSSVLIFLDSIFNNLGVTIIVFTILIRTILLPLTLPSIKSSKKIQELQPEMKKLKEKHGKDKQALALAQAQLYKSYNINPLAGCLPQLLQFFILIVLYQSIIKLFNNAGSHNLTFLWVNLGQFDQTYILPIVAGITQFLLSLMISPATQTRDIVSNDSKLKTIQEANKKEEDVAEMAATMQQQMIFMMPIMTVFISLKLPSGLALYWVIGTIITIVTQYFISGWGGLATYWNKYVAKYGPLKGKFLSASSGKSLTLIPKKIHVKENILSSVFKKPAEMESLANVLKNIGGNSAPAKPRNKRATKINKNIKKKHKNKKK